MRTTLALLALLAGALAHAEPPTVESIDRLIAASHQDRVLAAVLDNMEVSMRTALKAALKDMPMNAAQQKLFDEAPAKLVKVTRDGLNPEQLRASQIKVYQETFTQSDIDGLLAFYRSPAGSAYIDKMPLVVQRTNADLQVRLAPLVEQMKAAMQDAIAQIKAAQ